MSKIAGTKNIDTAAEALRVEVQRQYRSATASDEWDDGEALTDFRGEGARLNKFRFVVDAGCMCDVCTRREANRLVEKILVIERALIQGAGGTGNCEEVERLFLENHEVPDVHTVVPPHLRETPEAIEQIPERALKQLTVRHVVGVRGPV